MPAAGAPREKPSWLARNPVGTRVWTAGRLLVLAVLLSATFGAFFLTALRVTTRAREVKVPDLTNRSLTDATAALGDVGLVMRVELRRPDPKIAADHVIAQDPAPGSVLRRQRAVRVRVSEGQRSPALPSVVGQPERTADIVLSQAGVTVAGRAEIQSPSYGPDTIVGQDPPEEVRASDVNLLVNRGLTTRAYVMPDVIGTLGIQVRDMLRRRGFRVSVTADAPYPGLPPGVIVRQTPQAGFQVAFGDPILLEFSR
jgi:serine/threonine-protein kinase